MTASPERKGYSSKDGGPDLASRIGARAVIIAAIITAVGAIVAAVISAKG